MFWNFCCQENHAYSLRFWGVITRDTDRKIGITPSRVCVSYRVATEFIMDWRKLLVIQFQNRITDTQKKIIKGTCNTCIRCNGDKAFFLCQDRYIRNELKSITPLKITSKIYLFIFCPGMFLFSPKSVLHKSEKALEGDTVSQNRQV